MGCIYQATNLINGKRYIGKTVRPLRARRNAHNCDVKHGSQNCFHRAIRKYGLEAFYWDVLYENDNPSQLADMEKEFIRLLKTKVPQGYNLTDGGEGVPGFTFSEESRAKLSASHKGRKLTLEHRAKIAAVKKGKKRPPFSEEWRQHHAAAMRTPECRAKSSAAHKGRKLTPEQRVRHLFAINNRTVSPNEHAKRSASQLGRKRSPEIKAKLSAARKLWWQKRKELKKGVAEEKKDK